MAYASGAGLKLDEPRFTREIKLPPFYTVNINAPITARIITRATVKPHIILSGPGGQLSALKTFVKGDTLFVEVLAPPKKENQEVLTYPAPKQVYAKIYMPVLLQLNATNARISGRRLLTHNLKVLAAGHATVNFLGVIHLNQINQQSDGALRFEWVKANRLNVHADGRGEIYLAGAAHRLEGRLNHFASLNAKYLRTQEAYVQTLGHAVARVQPVKSLRAFAYDHGNIYYYKQPEFFTRYSQGSGNILKLASWG